VRRPLPDALAVVAREVEQAALHGLATQLEQGDGGVPAHRVVVVVDRRLDVGLVGLAVDGDFFGGRFAVERDVSHRQQHRDDQRGDHDRIPSHGSTVGLSVGGIGAIMGGGFTTVVVIAPPVTEKWERCSGWELRRRGGAALVTIHPSRPILLTPVRRNPRPIHR
jgi:hypothetical protein